MGLRVVFDTCVYGCIAVDTDKSLIETILKKNNLFSIIGHRVIRRELNNAAKPIRNTLLHLYEGLISKELEDDSQKVEALAKEYHSTAKALGKEYFKSWNEMANDFKIIASASIHGIDVVYSNDDKTMLGKYCQKAYTIVNFQKKLRTPSLIPYKTLRQALIKEISQEKNKKISIV